MTRWKLQRLGWMFFMALLAVSAGARTDPEGALAEKPKAPRPTQEIEPANCVTSECHTEVKDYQVVHGPAASGDCHACHALKNAEDHTFELWRQEEKLCTYCHEFDTGMLPVVHSPVIDGECLGCHNPHGGTSRSFTRETTVAKTCGRCHESVARGNQYLHHPVKTGECNTCHRPHASKYPNLLDAVGTDLCLSCHKDFAQRMAGVEFTHEALEEGCARCHATHGSNHPMELKQSVQELCVGCHEEIGGIAAAAEYKHSPVMEDCSCTTCHTAHGGNLASLMLEQPGRICVECHREKVSKDGGEMMTAMLRLSDPTRFQHTPVREGQCGGCHTLHGGSNAMLLHRPFPVEFHLASSEGKYDLCFECHDRRLAESEKAGDATEFRNGDRNLHFVHVSSSDGVGRNCRVCHGIHTSKYPFLLRDKVPYGNWQLVTRFEQTSTGGTCMTGCHVPYGYDRLNPMTSDTVTLATQSSPRVPMADKREPILVKWSALDVQGTEVRVPADDRPSVVLFLRADQEQSAKVAKMVLAASPQIDDAQVLVVFCGEDAEIQAKAFAAEETVPWPVIADPKHSICRLLGAEVWPATLVTQTDGVLVAHIGGAPPLLTADLRAYLDLANHKIDRETLKERVAQVRSVGDAPEKRAAWRLQVGRSLLENGKAEEARAAFAEGLKARPDSLELKVEMLRALIELKQGDQAMELLNQLPPEAMPSWDRDVLRGRALTALGRWTEARRVAEEILKQMPDLGAAHYLMGTIHQNDREWEKAAEEFRAAYANGVQ